MASINQRRQRQVTINRLKDKSTGTHQEAAEPEQQQPSKTSRTNNTSSHLPSHVPCSLFLWTKDPKQLLVELTDATINHLCKKEKWEINCEGSIKSETKTMDSPSSMNMTHLTVEEEVRRQGRRTVLFNDYLTIAVIVQRLISYQLKANGLAWLV